MAKWSIDSNSQVPIFQQIIDELERRILTGEMKANSFLPSVREFAVACSVNPNTVAKSYQQLQTLGLVESVRGKGLLVNELTTKRADNRKDQLLNLKIDECLDLANTLGYSSQKLIEMLRERSRK